MSVCFATIYKKFESEQRRLRQEYTASGMTEQQITAMYEFDKHQLARDLAYQRRSQPIDAGKCCDSANGDEGKSALLEKFIERLSVTNDRSCEHSRYWWIEEINSPTLAKTLCSLSGNDKELLTLYIFDDFNQKDIAQLQGVSQQSISKKIARLKKILGSGL